MNSDDNDGILPKSFIVILYCFVDFCRSSIGAKFFPDVLLNDIAGPDGSPLILSLKLAVDVLVSNNNQADLLIKIMSGLWPFILHLYWFTKVIQTENRTCQSLNLPRKLYCYTLKLYN